ncbi:hypothetical protein [Amycolatopsis sp. NPDC051102]|uniref:hypothetical protein n=1 Tax=Amycolatopsis sp. NPDC051102 TaxID=3155163 RepID=UPI0034423B2B
MPPIPEQPVPQDLQTVRHIVERVANFSQPVIFPYSDGSYSVRLMSGPESIAEVATDGHRWYHREIAADSSGEQPSVLRQAEAFLRADQRDSAQQAAVCVVQYLIDRLCATVRHPGSPIESRFDAAGKLFSIMGHLKGG